MLVMGRDPASARTGAAWVHPGFLSPRQETPGELVFVRYFVELPLRFGVAERALVGAPAPLTTAGPGAVDP